MKDVNEKLSWKQIVEKYPDEWVLLDDYEPDIDFDGVGILAKKGRILVHSKSEKDFFSKCKKVKANDTAKLWTGNIFPEDHDKVWDLANS